MLPRYSGKNRTFFFVDYEGFREVFGAPVVTTVPTAASRLGNFQGVTANGIYDPLTTRRNPSGGAVTRTRFPGDIVPPSRFDPVGAAMASL